MSNGNLKREKWTITFDRRLKRAVLQEARRQGVYPAQVLESLVKARFNPFGHGDIKNETAYVRKLRKKDRQGSDDKFLEDIRRWEKINS
jgi:hypothetical protein